MDYRDHLDALHRDTAGLLAAARVAAPTAPVPTCPGWTTIDLTYHIARVHHFWATIVADRLASPEQVVAPPRPAADADVIALAEESGRRLADALGAADPATPVWTWTRQQDVAFVARRMAQETAVHRYDAERTAGREHRIDPALASDGVDEFLFAFLPWAAPDAVPLDGSVHLHCTDVDGEWLIAVGADGIELVTREHAKGDAAMRGPAHDLLLVLWRRQPLDAVDVIGDRAVAARLVARTRLD
jgi:uncharacterized protein (TIGR03083 family)